MVGLIQDITEKNLVFIVNELSYQFGFSVLNVLDCLSKYCCIVLDAGLTVFFMKKKKLVLLAGL